MDLDQLNLTDGTRLRLALLELAVKGGLIQLPEQAADAVRQLEAAVRSEPATRPPVSPPQPPTAPPERPFG